MLEPRIISTRVVLDSETLEVLERDSYLYSGPVDRLDAAPTDAPPTDAPSDAPPEQASESEILDSAPEVSDAPPEEVPPETPAEEVPAEETPVEEPADPNAPAKPLTPQELKVEDTLKKAYRENFGQVKEILKANPALRPAFFKAAELNEIYTTVEDAKQAKEWATQLYKFDNLYYSPKAEDKRAFLQSLYENSQEQDGSSPHYDQIASLMVEDGLGNLYSRVQGGDPNISRAFSDLGLNGKQAMVAVQAVAAMFGIPLKGVRIPSGGTAPTGAPGAKSEQEQYLANEVARLNAEIQASRQSTLASTEQTFYNGIQTTFSSNLASAVAKAIEPASALKSQKPGFQTWVKSTIQQRTIDAVRGDEFFANQMEAMSRSGNRGPEHQRQLVAALEQRARQFLPDVVRDVLGEAGIQIQQKTNAARAQAGTPRREPATSGTPGRLSKPGERQSPNKPKPGESYEQFSRRVMELE